MKQEPLVLVTGISRGLGRAMADAFASLGYRVAGCARSADEIDNLSRTFGDGHLLRSVDVSDESAVSRFAEEVLGTQGAPDLLLNSAALVNRPAPLWEVPATEFLDLFSVNVVGTNHMIRHFLPAMIARGSGIIVNFSSGWGRSASPGVAPYCATKWAIEGLTAALAQDLPPGLGAVAFNPGIIDTEMLQTCFGESAAQYPQPAEWAEVAVPYLARLTARDNGKALTCPGF